jgi:hypothetical protein
MRLKIRGGAMKASTEKAYVTNAQSHSKKEFKILTSSLNFKITKL